jgi:carbonic anhydrase
MKHMPALQRAARLGLAGLLAAAPGTWAADEHKPAATHSTPKPAAAPAKAAASAQAAPAPTLAGQLRNAIRENKNQDGSATLTTSGNHADNARLETTPRPNVISQRVTNRPIMPVRPRVDSPPPGIATPTLGALDHSAVGKATASQSQYERARAIAHGKPAPTTHKTAGTDHGPTGGKAEIHEKHEPHWSYHGETGPEYWGRMKPEFNLCALGKRQSPINLQPGNTLVGPAEPLRIRYSPSNGSVVNNGHTIQVDLQGENTLTVRDSTYDLLQFHFHHPSEETFNGQPAAMVAHLVHRNAQGQLAVLAVPLQPGEANASIEQVWTHMPLEVGDRVRLPPMWLDPNALLPQDQRYYQFMGSLTTPPCSENVLWMVLKAPQTISPAQLRLFARLYPLNARPVQPQHDRVVREAQ